MRVLVVEDEENIVSYLTQTLKAEGFNVDSALDGAAGLAMALENDYDAITLDIMLPSMNGYEVCQRLREAGVNTPILMLTAKDGEYDEADAFDVGADDFLRKPFSLVVLIARLRALIRRSASASSAPVMNCGDLVCDQRAKTITRNGELVELTPREFTLVEYLIHNKEQVLSRSQILEHVWGSDYAGDGNVVDVYIGYVRKKIDTPFGTSSLKTIRGRGYMLVEDNA